jgi:hypothetical protein
MRLTTILFFVLFISVGSFGQKIKFTGVTYGPDGGIVVGAQIKALDERGTLFLTNTSDEGAFVLELVPGQYSLEVSGKGWLTILHPEILIVNSPYGRMTMDFVMFGSKFHEPCAYSGSKCLDGISLIRSYQVKYSPGLKQIRKEFDSRQEEKSTTKKNK